MGISRKFRWILLGAGVMALLYTFIIVIYSLRFMNVLLASVVILSIGVAIVFHPKGIKPFLKLMVVAYGVSFTIGGLGMALFFLTDLPYAVHLLAEDWEGFTRAISWHLALTGMVASYILIKIGIRFYEKLLLKRQMICNVQVFLDEKDCSFDALVDTGHCLKEPISQSSVIIAEFELVKSFLPDKLKILFYEKQENDLSALLLNREGSFYTRIRMIPFTSLGKTNGMLIGFRPDKVQIGKDVPVDVVIGIYNDKLSGDGRYRGLLSPELIGGV